MSDGCAHENKSINMIHQTGGPECHVVIECDDCGAQADHEFDLDDVLTQANEWPEASDLRWTAEA